MTKKTAAEVDIFQDDSAIPTSNWFKFTAVGDYISGTFVESFEKKSDLGTQIVYALKVISTSNPDFKEGDEVNVPLKVTTHKYNIQQLKSAEVGDVIGIKFSQELDTGKMNKAKVLDVRLRHVPKVEKEDVPF